MSDSQTRSTRQPDLFNRRCDLSISLNISGDFRTPIRCVRSPRQISSQYTPISSVPKVTITKDCEMSFRKHNIWPTRHITDVTLESKPQLGEFVLERDFMERALRTGVRLLNPANTEVRCRLQASKGGDFGLSFHSV